MSYPNGERHAGNGENLPNGVPPPTLSNLARQQLAHSVDGNAHAAGNQQEAPLSNAFQMASQQQQFNPNAAPFRPRYNQPSQPPPQPPNAGYPANLVSTLHSAPLYQQQYQPYTAHVEQSHHPMKGYPALNGPAQQQYYGGNFSVNGPPPPPTSMQMPGAVDAGQSVATSHHQPFNFSQQAMERVQISPNNFALFEIQIGLEQIINEPQEFDTWAGAIRSKLISSEFGEEDLSTTAALIIEMAVMAASSQYNFSRLCQNLDQTIGDFVLHYLLPQLTHLSAYISEERQNYILFLAELYDKLSGSAPRGGGGAAGSGDSARRHLSKLIGQQLFATLETSVDDALLKTVVRVLKLTGRLLEADLGTEWTDKLFGALNALCSVEDGKLSESVKCQVLSLNQLRHNSWGVTKPDPTAGSSSTGGGSSAGHPTSSSLSSILIVGPDGKPLSEEEVRFLDEQMGGSSMANGGSGASPSKNSWNEAIMDDEVMDEYEQFLQDTAMRAAEKALERVSIDDDEDSGGATPEDGKK